MTKVLKSQSGMTMLEVSAGLVILGVLATVMNSYLLIQQVGSLKQEKQTQIQDVVMQNVAELHGKGLEAYPDAGSCLTRYYSGKGIFIREETGANGDAACINEVSPNGAEIKVTMRFRQNLSGTMTFEPAAFLKLPSSDNTLFEVEIVGTYNPPSGKTSAPLTLTILKRKKA